MRNRMWKDILKMSLLGRELVWNRDKQLFHGPIAEIGAEGDIIGIRCEYAEVRMPQSRVWARLPDISPIVALRSRFQMSRIAPDGMIMFEITGIGLFAILPEYVRIRAMTVDPFGEIPHRGPPRRREMLWSELFNLSLGGSTAIRVFSSGVVHRAIIQGFFANETAATIHFKDSEKGQRNDHLKIWFDEEPKLPVLDANGTILLRLRGESLTIHPTDDYKKAG